MFKSSVQAGKFFLLYICLLFQIKPVTQQKQGTESLEEQLAETEEMLSLWRGLAILFLVLAVIAFVVVIILGCLLCYRKCISDNSMSVDLKPSNTYEGEPMAVNKWYIYIRYKCIIVYVYILKSVRLA